MTPSRRDSQRERPRPVVVKYDRWHRFVVARSLDARGLDIYHLENAARRESLFIPHEFFERFRAAVRDTSSRARVGDSEPIRTEMRFGGRTLFRFRWEPASREQWSIESFGTDDLPNRELVVSVEAGPALVSALYQPTLRHPNELLDRIVTYHRLFSATFSDASDSMTSALLLRRGLLSGVERYVPALAERSDAPGTVEPAMLEMLAPVAPEVPASQSFRSRLGERDELGQYQVDYEALFTEAGPTSSRGGGSRSQSRTRASSAEPEVSSEALPSLSLPLLAAELKLFNQTPFRCELTREDVLTLRRSFLDDRDASFHIGFEIIDCIFEARGALRSFRFPLYYLPVRIVESGREIILHPLEDNRFYLNHFALVQVMENYGPSTQAAKRLSELLSSLLSHQFVTQGARDRIRIMRRLPCHTEVFDRTREILLGLPGEKGKGGLLAEVQVRAIECDLESVGLYKVPPSDSVLTQALNHDLGQIVKEAATSRADTKSSLLVRTLDPQPTATDAENPFSRVPSMHGQQPRSIRALIERLNAHDLVLLEGPPGTGKTYNIANLVIHCVATNQRLLVVSDQKAAVEALAEQLQTYLLGPDRNSPEAQELELLWKLGVKVLDEVPETTGTLANWVRQIRRMLGIDALRELEWPAPVAGYDDILLGLDQKIEAEIDGIGATLARSFGSDTKSRLPRVAEKSSHPVTTRAVDQVVDLLQHLTACKPESLRRFVEDRERILEHGLGRIYDLLALGPSPEAAVRRLQDAVAWLGKLEEAQPVRLEDFDGVQGSEGISLLREVLRLKWQAAFPSEPGWTVRAARFVRSLASAHELHRLVSELRTLVQSQLSLIQELGPSPEPSVWESLARVHSCLSPSSEDTLDVVLELWLAPHRTSGDQVSVQTRLETLTKLQKERDQWVRRQFVYGLAAVGKGGFTTPKGSSTNRLTSILATLDRLESAGSWSRGAEIVEELQALLFDVFPIWICRKQAVPFVLPCRPRSFDLVIVDEATQCRVDDAIPLLFRATKLMVVGDEKQTVRAKNSAVDDYLFDDFELDEHLSFTQARHIKGGGSHLFGLVKRIKQASVMLDEHYRCPPDIIEFSNHYVYDNQLRIMQWKMRGTPSSVSVDHGESRAESSPRQSSGKYKGIETAMIDRFFAYVGRTLRRLERDTGIEINPETDVAIVYFLLKNETYIKDAKGKLLKKLPRGSDVLDGAGAALQGKERDYIFYLWDVTRYNIGVFRQGDDETKRKGELNVLMSRPKRRSYHYLHRDFEHLKHHTCSITDYLWGLRQTKGRTKTGKPVWGSGLLIRRLLDDLLGPEAPVDVDLQLGVQVGHPILGVDLMWLPPEERRDRDPSIGVVDLSAFSGGRKPGQEVADYYFQLQRAIPRVVPVFGFIHEFFDPRSTVSTRLRVGHKSST